MSSFRPKLITSAVDNDKPDSFKKISTAMFGRELCSVDTKISFTFDQLREFHDRAHETGRIRERSARQKFV